MAAGVIGVGTDFAHTRAALKVYDAAQADRDKMYEAIATNADVEAWIAREARDAQLVRDAFFEDTGSFNSRAACNATEISWLRGLVGKAR